MKLDENLLKEFNQRLLDIYKFNHKNVEPLGIFATYGAAAYLTAFSQFMIEKEIEQGRLKYIGVTKPKSGLAFDKEECKFSMCTVESYSTCPFNTWSGCTFKKKSEQSLLDSDLLKKTQEERVRNGIPKDGINYNGEPRK